METRSSLSFTIGCMGALESCLASFPALDPTSREQRTFSHYPFAFPPAVPPQVFFFPTPCLSELTVDIQFTSHAWCPLVCSYPEFAPMFRAEMFDPDEWADLFKKSGAKCEINQLLAIQQCKLIASRLSIKNEVLLYSLLFHQEDTRFKLQILPFRSITTS